MGSASIMVFIITILYCSMVHMFILSDQNIYISLNKPSLCNNFQTCDDGHDCRPWHTQIITITKSTDDAGLGRS